jgi:chorismate mutase
VAEEARERRARDGRDSRKELAAVLFSAGVGPAFFKEVLAMRIEDCREEIDRIDGELLRLLNRRALLALEIGEIKARAGLPVIDEGREREVLARSAVANRGPLCGASVARIFRRIVRESRRAEESARGSRRASRAGVER